MGSLKFTNLDYVNPFKLYYDYLQWYNTLVTHKDPIIHDELKRCIDALAEIEDYIEIKLGAELTLKSKGDIITTMIIKTKLGERRYEIQGWR